MALESFYGGKQGISPVIKKSFWFVEDNFKNEDFFTYVWNEINNLKNSNSNYSNLSLPNENSESLNAWLNTVSSNDLKNEEVIQEILNNTMNTQFAKGNEYTDVWYSEYCIIDSPNKNFKDNGKLFRRTLNSRNESNTASYAEYIGTLRGPSGQNPHVNITSLKQLKEDFSNNKNVSDVSLSYPGKPGELQELFFDIENEGISANGNQIIYSWYQVDDLKGETSTIKLGFQIPAPQIQVNTVKTVAWNRDSDVTKATLENNTNPFLTKFNFEISRGVKGTSVDNIRLKKLKDFKNLELLLNFFLSDNLNFFDSSDNFNDNFFINEIEETEDVEEILNYFKDNFLYYFNNTVKLNFETGQATIDEEKNWKKYLEDNNKNDKDCWLYFLGKIIGKDSLIYTKIKNLLEQNSFFDENNKKINISDNSNNIDIINDIKELPILVYDIIFYDKSEETTDNSAFEINSGNYTFFLCEYDSIKDIIFDPDRNELGINFYYKDNEIFSDAIPLITKIEYNSNLDSLIFTFNNDNTNTKTVQLNSITGLEISDGIIYYNNSNNDSIRIALNNNSKLNTYRIQQENEKIYVITSLINPSEDATEEKTFLGETFNFSFKGVLINDTPISISNINDWINYLNTNCIENYEDGVWIGTDNLGGSCNLYNKVGNQWKYLGNGFSSWPSFYTKQDIIQNNNIDLNTQERTLGNNNEQFLSSTEKIVFGELSVSLSQINPFSSFSPNLSQNTPSPSLPSS